MKGLDYTTLVIVIIGAINWLLIGLFKFDLVAFYFRKPYLAFQNHLCFGGNLRFISLYFFWKNRKRKPGLRE